MGLTIVRMTGIGGVTTIEIGMVAFIVDGIMMAAVVGIAANSKAVRFRQSQRIGRLVSEAPEVGRRCIEAQSRTLKTVDSCVIVHCRHDSKVPLMVIVSGRRVSYCALSL
jgi:hypothetical protein